MDKHIYHPKERNQRSTDDTEDHPKERNQRSTDDTEDHPKERNQRSTDDTEDHIFIHGVIITFEYKKNEK